MTPNQEEIKRALESIETEEGRLTPEGVVAAARDHGSPLHPLFDWDDASAARAHRLNRAREIIRSVRVLIRTDRTTVPVVAYVRDPDAPADQQGYIATARIIGDADRSRAVLVEEFSRAASALRRARELSVAFNMESDVDASIVTVETMRARVELRESTQ